MNIITCPTCGERTLKKVCDAWTFEVRGKRTTIPNVPRLRCTACGEELFDRESHRAIEANRPRRARRRVAA